MTRKLSELREARDAMRADGHETPGLDAAIAKREALHEAKPSWTAGPWRIDPASNDECVLGHDGALVADCGIYGSDVVERQGEWRASNARLVAAAPELFNALAVLLAAGDAYDESEAGDQRIRSAIELGRQALIRAEGGKA